MTKHSLILLSVLLTYLHIITARKIHQGSAPNPHPVPPQPSQYTASVLLNERSLTYYADTTVYRDRFDGINNDLIAITDFKNYRHYEITETSCSWSQIPGKIKPLLEFSTYEFVGNVTNNGSLNYLWKGCHDYEIPPAPFFYYAIAKTSIPVYLLLPTIGASLEFSNFTYGPPPSSLFDIPSNCTQAEYNRLSNPIFLNAKIETHNVQMLC